MTNWSWLHWLRRLAAGLFLVAGIYLTSIRTVCEEKLANTGGQGTVRVCHSLAVTDVPVLAGLFLVLLLLLPDLSEIGIPGFLSLKRQVSQQESKLEDQAATLTSLQTQLAQAMESQQTVTQRVDTRTAAMNVNVYDFNELLQGFEAKSDRALSPASDLADQHPDEVIPAARAQLEARMVRVWAQLEQPVTQGERTRMLQEHLAVVDARLNYLLHEEKNIQTEIEALRSRDDINPQGLQLASRRQAETMEMREMAQHERAHLSAELELKRREAQSAFNWNRDFQQEIEVVRAAYDAVTRAEPIEDSKLSAAVRLADGLLEAWKGRNDTPSKPGEATAD